MNDESSLSFPHLDKLIKDLPAIAQVEKDFVDDVYTRFDTIVEALKLLRSTDETLLRIICDANGLYFECGGI